jgi:hypothetical protein
VQQSCTLVLQIKSFGGAPPSLAVHRVARAARIFSAIPGFRFTRSRFAFRAIDCLLQDLFHDSTHCRPAFLGQRLKGLSEWLLDPDTQPKPAFLAWATRTTFRLRRLFCHLTTSISKAHKFVQHISRFVEQNEVFSSLTSVTITK